jgi:hypothetical protein
VALGGPPHFPGTGLISFIHPARNGGIIMRRFAGILTAFAFAASLTSAPVFAKPHDHMRGNSMMAPGHMKHRCPPGQHWVKGYHKKNGQKVKGYCR